MSTPLLLSSSPSTPSSIHTVKPPRSHQQNGIRTPPLSPRPLPPMRPSSPPTAFPTPHKSRRSSIAGSSRPPSRSEVRSPVSFSPMMALAMGLPLPHPNDQLYHQHHHSLQQQQQQQQQQPYIHRPQPLRPIGLGPHPPLSASTIKARPNSAYVASSAPSTPRAVSGRHLPTSAAGGAAEAIEIPRAGTLSPQPQQQPQPQPYYQHSPISRPGTPLKREREREAGGEQHQHQHQQQRLSIGTGGGRRRSSAFRASSPSHSPLLAPSAGMGPPPPLSRPGSPLLRAAHHNSSSSSTSNPHGRSPRRPPSRSPSLNRASTAPAAAVAVMKVAIPPVPPPRACSGTGTASTPSTFFSNVVATVTPGSGPGTSSTIASPVPLPMGRLPGEGEMSEVLGVSGGDYFAWSTGVEDHWLNASAECSCPALMGGTGTSVGSSAAAAAEGECTCGRGGERYDGERARKLLRGCLEADEEERSARTSRRNSTEGGVAGRSRRGSFRSSPSDIGEQGFFGSELDLDPVQASSETPPISCGSVTRTAHSSTAESCSSYVSFSSLNCPPPSPPTSPLIGLTDGPEGADDAAAAAAAAAAPAKKKGWVWG